MSPLDIMIVGPHGNTHLAGSLARAGGELGLKILSIDTAPAYNSNVVLKSLYWRLGKRRAVHMRRFSENVAAALTAAGPRVLLTIGQLPLDNTVISLAQREGVLCVHWSTDDPWNAACIAGWYLRTLAQYDLILTPRRSNISDLEKLGCRQVIWMPFGYDPGLFAKPPDQPCLEPVYDVVFVGGADKDRAGFFVDFIRHGGAPVFVGAYWQRWPEFRERALGSKNAEELTLITATAKVNLCLVRRANRDGHVMRSFEIPAVGGFMLAENTAEHRELFGPEGEAVLYFATASEAAQKVEWALENPKDRRRMAAAAHELVRRGNHTYRHRLESLLDLVTR